MRAMTTGAVRCEGQAIRCETIGTMFRMLVFCQIGKAVRDQALSLGKTHMHLKMHKHTHSHTLVCVCVCVSEKLDLWSQ